MNLGQGYHIRPGTPGDVPRLPPIELAAGRQFLGIADQLGLTPEMLDSTNTEENFARAQQAGLLWVAADAQDAPVGFALLMELDGCLHLEELDVHPAHSGQGLGAALVGQVCAWADTAGYPGVTLSTFRDVPWNAPFYARHGFRPLEPGELTPGLLAIRSAERGHGLRTDLRIIMRRARRPASPAKSITEEG